MESLAAEGDCLPASLLGVGDNCLQLLSLPLLQPQVTLLPDMGSYLGAPEGPLGGAPRQGGPPFAAAAVCCLGSNSSIIVAALQQKPMVVYFNINKNAAVYRHSTPTIVSCCCCCYCCCCYCCCCCCCCISFCPPDGCPSCCFCFLCWYCCCCMHLPAAAAAAAVAVSGIRQQRILPFCWRQFGCIDSLAAFWFRAASASRCFSRCCCCCCCSCGSSRDTAAQTVSFNLQLAGPRQQHLSGVCTPQSPDLRGQRRQPQGLPTGRVNPKP